MNNQNEISALKAEIVKLTKEIENLKNRNIETDLLNELKKLSNEIDLDKIKEKLPEEKFEEVKEKSKKIIEEIEEFTKNHPLATILGAAALGYLLGKINK